MSTEATTAPPAPSLPPLLLRLAEGPADLFCSAVTRGRSFCKTPLRADGTCPGNRGHHWGGQSATASLRRMDAPPLIQQYPLCPLCEHEVWHDGDGFQCDRCRMTWSGGGNDHGSPLNSGDRYQCEATTQDGRVRCILDEDHAPLRTLRLAPWLAHADERGYVTDRIADHAGIPVGPDGYPDEFGGLFEWDGERWSA